MGISLLQSSRQSSLKRLIRKDSKEKEPPNTPSDSELGPCFEERKCVQEFWNLRVYSHRASTLTLVLMLALMLPYLQWLLIRLSYHLHGHYSQCYSVHRHLNNSLYNNTHSLVGKPYLEIIANGKEYIDLNCIIHIKLQHQHQQSKSNGFMTHPKASILVSMLTLCVNMTWGIITIKLQ